MSLKCSLLGHRYDDTETRRDQTRDGTELVETVQEVKVCARCGETLVISETTEVRTVTAENSTPPPADGPASHPTGDGAGTRTAGTTETGAMSRADEGGGPAVGRADEGGGPAAGRADEGGGPAAGRADEGGGPAAGRADEGGGPAVGGADEGGGPAAGRADEGGAPIGGTVDRALGETDDDAGAVDGEGSPTRTDDAVIIDDDGEEKPVSGQSAEDDETGIDEGWEPDLDPDTGGRRDDNRGGTDGRDGSDTRESPGGQNRGSGGGLTVPEGEFHCPECGFTTAVESSSLRAGDFCPECHRGALEHRSD